MGVLNKIKNMFTEEYEEEEEVKKEVIKVEIPSPKEEMPKKEEKQIEEKIEPVEVLEEPKEEFKFPIFFDDKDFEGLKKETPKREEKKRNKETYGLYNPVKEEKKTFKPTPIISPVYGILDKNYHKEDIKAKQTISTYYNPKDITIDEVRKKAYGTLEDDLESTLFDHKPISFEKPDDEKLEAFEEDIFDEVDSNDDLLDLEGNDPISEEPKKISDDDLFNLIDNMYANKE